MLKYPRRAAIICTGVVGLAVSAQAMGKKPAPGSPEDIQPVRRGSAANPNPAFTPPTFQPYGRTAPGAVTVKPRATPHVSAVSTAPPPTNDALPAPGNTPIPEQPAPPPKAQPSSPGPADAGVPSIPLEAPDSANPSLPPAQAPAPAPTSNAAPTQAPGTAR
ncbi:MAG TPA: hypothetical protein VMU17_02675 [Elusimicrobiota bacterium]|nr:hypothetical protein [Elusimicrobiota bacterium]